MEREPDRQPAFRRRPRDRSGTFALPSSFDESGPPLYPETARRSGIEGLVVLEAIISAAGQIEDVRIVKSAGALLDSAAEEAVRGWKYPPATLNRRAVRVLLTVTISFRLHWES